MRAVIQRVTSAECRVEGASTGAIGPGLLVFLGVEDADDDDDLAWLSQKVLNLRIFSDSEGRMNRSVTDIHAGGILVISQFTLFGSLKKGSRPSFNRAGKPEYAKRHYEAFVTALRETLPDSVATGQFAADMKIEAHNDGPVTLVIDTKLRDF
ncbi:MAG: D-aminoacyl-tRNA deacylase [Verrucomicrobiota bacterium]